MLHKVMLLSDRICVIVEFTILHCCVTRHCICRHYKVILLCDRTLSVWLWCLQGDNVA